jgi:putative photosynthetic complex assembly protein 2
LNATMTYLTPILGAVFIWWFSTGVIFLLDRLPRATHMRSLILASAGALVAFAAIGKTAGMDTQTGAYIAFGAAIMVWGWHELAFLLGFLTGPRRAACPPDATRTERFWLAVQALAYHELAILATLGLVATMTWEAPNQVALWTFAVLFGMRLSAKLNIFLGVPHLNVDMLPVHLDFLKSYFSRRPMNGLFPVSVTVSTLLGAYVFHAAFMPGASAYEVAAYGLTGSLILLGTLEHWLLILRMQTRTEKDATAKTPAHQDRQPGAGHGLVLQRLSGHGPGMRDRSACTRAATAAAPAPAARATSPAPTISTCCWNGTGRPARQGSLAAVHVGLCVQLGVARHLGRQSPIA